MPYCKAWQERMEKGLCANCGGDRKGRTTRFCATCAANQSAVQQRYSKRRRANPNDYTTEAKNARRKPSPQEKHDQRLTQGLCVNCGNRRTSGDKRGGFLNCHTCRARQREYDEVHRRRERIRSGLSETGDPLPLGSAVPNPTRQTMRHSLTVQLDLEAWKALSRLSAKDGGAYNGSRLVRECIRFWKDRYPCPKRKASYRLCLDGRITFRYDDDLAAILKRHAQDRDGNLVITVCDMIAAISRRPKVFGATATKRHNLPENDPDFNKGY